MNRRIKKSILEANYMVKADDMAKIAPKLGKDDVVKVIDEDGPTSVDSETLSLSQLIRISRNAGKIAIEAEGELIDLGIKYSENTPLNLVKQILGKYKIQYEDVIPKKRPNSGAEGGVFEAKPMVGKSASKNDAKIENFVNTLNELIKNAVDSDGDPIAVVDRTSTWPEGYIYAPIVYSNGQLRISSRSEYKKDFETEVILKRNMEFDGIPTLRMLMRMYKAAIKKASKPQPEVSEVSEDEHARAGRSIEYGQREPELSDSDYEELLQNMKNMGENVAEGKLVVSKNKLIEIANKR